MRSSLYVLAGGFFSGVLWRSFFLIDQHVLVALIACVLVLLMLTRLTATVRFSALYLALAVLALVVGAARTELAHRSFEEGKVLADESMVEGAGTVVEEPDVRDSYTLLTIALDNEHVTRVRARVPHYPEVAYGARIAVRGTVHTPTEFETEAGRNFNYPAYLMKDHVHYELRRAEVTPFGEHAGNPLVRVLLALKSVWLDAVSDLFPEPSASLLGGLVVGAKQSLGEEWLDKFRDTGIVHIVVLSGYNLTVVAVFMVWLAGRFSRSTRFVVGAIGIVSFALMVGAGATVVRASVMALLALAALTFERPYEVVRGLVLAAFFMVLWNPFVLAFDPGFQLSFIATLGLIFGAPLVERHLALVPTTLSLRTIVAATLATQAAVLPLLAYQIGEVSLVAPLVNLLILPLVPLVMVVGFAAGLVGTVSTVLALPLAMLANLLLGYTFLVVDLFASLKLSSVALPSLPVWLVAVTYGALTVFVWRTVPSPRSSPNESTVRVARCSGNV